MESPTENEVITIENTPRQFVCKTTPGKPVATFRWYLEDTNSSSPDEEITTGKVTTPSTATSAVVSTGTLTYRPQIRIYISKIYCTASNVDGQVQTSAHKPTLTIHYPPTITSIPNKSIVAGQTLTQMCTVSSGNPTVYTYRWTRSSNTLSQTRTLSLSSEQTLTAATYTCIVENTMTPTGQTSQTGQETETFTLSVLCQTSHARQDAEDFTLSVLTPPTSPTFTYKNQAVSGTSLSFIYNTPGDSLSCESTGNPSPNYRWQRQGASVISTSRDLTLATIQKDQGGVYKCIAYNTLSPTTGVGGGDKSSTTTITLNVLYSSTTPSLRYNSTSEPSIPSNSLKVLRGDNVKVACSADSKPAPHYQWSDQSGDSQILTINSIQTDTTRTCTATNTLEATNSGSPVSRSASTTVTIIVMYAPTEPTLRYNYGSGSVTLTGPLLMIEGDSGTVSCSGSTSKQFSDAYNWYSNSGITSTGATLNIKNVAITKAGIQTCRVTNTMDRTFGNDITGVYNKSLTVTVLYPPSILLISPQRVNEGSLLSVTCATRAGNPPQTTYTWTRSGDSWRRTSQTFTIQGTTRTDAGDYTCKAQNIMVPTKPSGQQPGVDAKTVQVTVEYTPDVTVTTTNTTVNTVTVDIVCSPSGVPTRYTYQPWTQHWSPGVEIIHTPGLDNNPKLQLTQLSYQHSGIYTCTAGNGVYASNNPAAGSGSIYLLVKSKPIVTEPTYNNGNHHKLYVALNSQSSLVLKYYSNAGDTTVTVNSKIGGNIGANVFTIGAQTPTNVQLPVFTQTVASLGINTTLTFIISAQQQFGRYEVVLRNANGLPDTLFKMDIAPKQRPEVPSHMTSANVTQTTATLTWVRGFHGGSDQTFVVQLRPDNIQWTNKTVVDDGQKDSNTTVVTVTIDGLTPGTKYYVRVFAFNQEGHNDEYSNVHNFNTQTVSHVTEDNTSSLGGILGGTIAAVVVIVLVVVAVVLSRKYECQKKSAKPQSTGESKNQYENVMEANIDNVQIHSASEQGSYYNIGRESEPVPSTYETLSDREPTPNMYSSLQNIEMAPITNIASNPAVSEPIQSQYESLTDREADPNMYSSLDNTESSPGGKVALNPEKVYINLKV